MTVYFVGRQDDPSIVKIGHTDELEDRMVSLSSAYEDGIELLAQCDGGRDVEFFLHQLFIDNRREGEWFEKTAALSFIIDKFKEAVTGRRLFGRRADHSGDALKEDRRIAAELLQVLMKNLSNVGDTLAVSQERSFQILSAANAAWTRRRVRAIWERKSRRIEHFEIRNLESAVDLTTQTIGEKK